MKIGPPQPWANVFSFDEDETYADTDIRVWHAARLLEDELTPIRFEELDSETDCCNICMEPMVTSKGIKIYHAPVQTPCGHMFGESCIRRWLAPLKHEYSAQGIQASEVTFEGGKNSCPSCRRVFFAAPEALESWGEIGNRLFLWEKILKNVGFRLSDEAATARVHLINYVRKFQVISGERYTRQAGKYYKFRAMESVLRFTLRRSRQPLNPLQIELLKDILVFTRGNMKEMLGTSNRRNEGGNNLS